MTEEATIPTQFTHSVKISDTAKGVRIDVHVYANSQQEAIKQAVETYLKASEACTKKSIKLAPVEVEDNKK